ncbi:MAG: phosphotransferase [Sphingomonas sp.]|uniref:phosphotransferase n=1 Tax=Sphingomonas sp. TaxID=28214 RepID=UPI0035A90679|nr:phosphotransferase [Sphingomonas sp.]
MTAPIWLTAADVALIADRLRALGWLAPDEALSDVTTAGDGNLNLVLRVSAGSRSAILKQARPWVEKYPTIAAPVARSAVEASFYRLVHAAPALGAFMPQLLGVDPAWHLLLLEDVGRQADSAALYHRASADPAARARLVAFMAGLHALAVPHAAMPDNRAMLVLNHAHIFTLPFAQADRDLAATASLLGDRYLLGAGPLLHGDFFPGAWVYGDDGVKVIDPEFCLFGPPEFDLGVMVAHLIVAGDEVDAPNALSAAYQSASGGAVDAALVGRFAGIELWRRLHGVAPLPAPIDDQQKAALTALAARLIRA